MKDYFTRTFSETRIRDFSDDFKEKRMPIEVRTDRLTGRVSRILGFRWKLPRPSHDLALIEKAREVCPFCPERLDTATPMFPEEIIPGGRVRHGRSTVIPNAYPYCSFCGVTIFREDHYIPMDRISPELLTDPIGASLRWFDLLSRYDGAIRYYAINWNYMPTSGGSLFHPHFQVVANPAPTTFQARLITETARYRRDRGAGYWADLVAYEKKKKERYLFAIDGVEFLTSFSPGGIFGEVLALFCDKTAISDLSEANWRAFLDGLCRILRCFHRMNLDNLNMTLFLSRDGDADFWVQARIMPRVLIPPWGTSDVNYFEKGHDEKVVIFSPEDLAEAIRITP